LVFYLYLIMGKAERTKEYITQKIAPLFNRKGYAGTSLSDMTDATGLTKGSIYGNFDDKDAVALAAFDHNMNKLIGQVRELQSTERSATGKLKAFITVYRNGSHSGVLKDGCPIINSGTEADDTHPQLKEKTNAALTRWHKSIAAIIQQGKMQGEFNEGTNSSALASLMIAMIEGGFTLSKISGDQSYLDQSLDQLEMIIAAQLKK
jgi:TetR/AcrR family transcriptional repressor of nem operon